MKSIKLLLLEFNLRRIWRKILREFLLQSVLTVEQRRCSETREMKSLAYTTKLQVF